MDRKDYVNSITTQVMDIVNLADTQPDTCFDLDMLKALVSPEEASKFKRVIMVGCGDSYSAVGAMSEAMRKLSGIRSVNTPDIMDFDHYYTERKILGGNKPEEVLLIAVSFSGGAKKVAEALEKGSSLGLETMLITRTPDSLSGRAAKKVFDLKTPDGLNTPGLRSYYASMVGITAMAAYIGLCNGTLTEEEFCAVKADVVSTTKNFMAEIDRIDELMFNEAVRMKDLTHFETLADWNEGYSAQFIEQKFIECAGVYCDHVNSEEYVHISIMFAYPERFGTVVLLNKSDKSLSRMKATLYGLMKQERPTVVVTDVEDEFFSKPLGFDVNIKMYGREFVINGADLTNEMPVICRIPTAARPYLSPLVDFIPGSLLAGYYAVINGIKFFGGRYDGLECKWDA